MRRSRVFIDVQSIGIGVQHIRGGAQRLEHRFGDIPCTAVGTIQPHVHAAERIHAQRNQISDITVSPRSIVNRFSDVFAQCIGQLGITVSEYAKISVEIILDERNHALVHFFALGIDQFDPVIEVRIMTCGNHNPAVERVDARDIRNRWRRGYVQHISVCTRRSKTCNQGVLEHITRSSGILPDDDSGSGPIARPSL